MAALPEQVAAVVAVAAFPLHAAAVVAEAALPEHAPAVVAVALLPEQDVATIVPVPVASRLAPVPTCIADVVFVDGVVVRPPNAVVPPAAACQLVFVPSV